MTSIEHDRIAEVIDSTYVALSFGAGEAPDWARFDRSFATGALLALRLFPSDPTISVLDLHSYAKAQLRLDLQERGYSETPGTRDIRTIGDVAVVFQNFTMDFPDGTSTAAVDVFSLAKTGHHWKIISVVSDLSTE